MFKYLKSMSLLAVWVAVFFVAVNAMADITPEAKEKLKTELQGDPKSVMDQQQNTISNLQFYTTNYGIFGLNVERSSTANAGGGYWPRNSVNQYIFGGGIWFGAKKYLTDTSSTPELLCSITYNPNSGKGWYVPGRIYEYGPKPDQISSYKLDANMNDRNTYRNYLSTDYNLANGVGKNGLATTPNWPIWDDRENDTLKVDRYFGHYIEDKASRNTQKYKKGPAFISGEDIFATYKDTDLSRYEAGADKARKKGYPMMLQVEQYIYSWGFGDYRDFIFLRYDITNYSDDTLRDCWLAPVMDVDIGRAPNTAWGASNDRTRYYSEEPDLNLAVQWSNTDRGEKSAGFGYLGFDFLESPAVVNYYDSIPKVETGSDGKLDTIGWKIILNNDKWTAASGKPMPGSVRRDKKWYTNEEQLGLVTMNNWNIADDKIFDADRYNYLSLGKRDDDNGPGDKRFMMATGPFNVLPTDTFRTVVCIVLANTVSGKDADGTVADMGELIRKDKFAQSVYDNNFKAPAPPSPTNFTSWRGGNHSVTVTWDTASIWATNDVDERGLDFMGYKLYRARRYNLDTFDIDQVAAGGKYSSGKGPLGWKEIGRWEVPTPFYKTPIRGGYEQDNPSMPLIDSYRLLGPAVNSQGKIIDSMAIRVMRQPKGVGFFSESSIFALYGYDVPVIAYIDSTTFGGAPWNKHFARSVMKDGSVPDDQKTGSLNYFTMAQKVVGGDTTYNITGSNKYKIFDDMVGDYVLSASLLGAGYNPLYFKRHIEEVNADYVINLKNVSWFSDYRVGDTVHAIILDSLGQPTGKKDTVRTTLDTIYYPKTLMASNTSSTGWVMEVETPYKVSNPYELLRDTAHVSKVLSFLYGAIANNLIETKQTTLSDFESSTAAKHVVSDYLDKITNNRTFTDLGDDNRDGYIEYDDDALETEKIINNVEYYYKMISYDEGDFMQPTPKKENVAPTPSPQLGKSSVTTVPTSQAVGVEASFEIVSKTEDKLGSLNNFNFYPIDMQRVQEHFAGDTMRLEFTPYWQRNSLLLEGSDEGQPPFTFGLYQSQMYLINETKGDTLYDAVYSYESTPCGASYYELYSENAASVVLKRPEAIAYDTLEAAVGAYGRIDTITFQMRSDRSFKQKASDFNSGDFREPGYCYTYNMDEKARGIFGFEFDYEMRQYGGVLRPDTAIVNHAKEKGAADVLTPVLSVDENYKMAAVSFELASQIKTSQYASWDYNLNNNMAAGFNNGPGVYKITFKAGGTENVKMAYGAPAYTENFTAKVDYLAMEVENIYSYDRMDLNGDTVTVSYPGIMPPIVLPPVAKYDKRYLSLKDLNPFPENRLYPDPRNLGQTDTNSYTPYKLSTNDFIGKYNVASYAWYNRRDGAAKPPFNVAKAKYMAVNMEKTEDNSSIFELIKFDKSFDANDKQNNYSGLRQNRYYLSTKVGDKWLDFTHEIQVDACSFALDYANAGYFTQQRSIAGNTLIKDAEYFETAKDANGNFVPKGRDFKAGDVIYVGVTGGAAGFPLPGANVRFTVKTNADNVKYTEDILDDVKIVPNPYYIGHQGQSSPYGALIYFTKLPSVCTVSIYTSSGQLVRELKNNQTFANNTGVIEWDLLNQNGQRCQSQPLVAVIETPDGTRSMQNFAIVVGGFKIITDF